MTMYTEDRRPQMGWGEKVPMFFNSSVTVKNWALGGRSSRSFYYEATRWPAILPQINAGDYVIIQFGHNDQRYGSEYAGYGTYAYCADGSGNGETCSGGPDAVDATVDKAEHSYYQFLKRYVQDVRSKGANPILMTPIARKYFSGTKITPEGLHDWSSKVATGEANPRGNYPAAMKAVATKYNVPLVDLTTETRAIVESYGDAAATANLYIPADSTHPQVLFATLIAKKAVEGMAALNILKNYKVDVTSLVASPSKLDWANRYLGVASVKNITISAFDLLPAAGTVKLTAPSSAFELSADQATWSSTLNVDYTNGAFTKTVYVRFTPTAVQTYSGNIGLALIGGASLGTVAVSGAGVAPGAGLTSYASWFTAGSALAPVTDGLLTANDAVANNLTATTTKVLPVNGQDTSVARFTVDWASRDATKYLEFVVTPAGKYSIDYIGAYLSTSGGSTVQADIEYSTDKTTWTKLNSNALSWTKDTMALSEFNVTAEVASGAKFYLRIYPWNTAANAGKQLALYNVKVSGKVAQ